MTLPSDPFVLAANVLVIWSAIVGTASVIVHSRVAWWRTAMGVHLMAYMSVMAAVLLLAVVRMFLGDAWWFSLFRLVVFVGVPVVMTQRLVFQLKARRGAADAPLPERTDR